MSGQAEPRCTIKWEKGSYLPDDSIRRLNESWCGRKFGRMEWAFIDAAHVAAHCDNQGSQQPCKECLRGIITTIEKEL